MAAIVGLLVLMVYLCTNIAYKFIPDKAKKNVKRMFTRKKDGAAAEDDAVLIRQICICPCAIMPVIKAAQPAAAEDIDDKQLGKMAEKAVRWKLRGDRALVQTYVIHLFYVLGALIFVARYPSWSKKALSSQTSTRAFPVTNPWEFMAVYVLYSEFLNFFVWFIKFLPLFIILFPIHKARCCVEINQCVGCIERLGTGIATPSRHRVDGVEVDATNAP